MSLQHVTFRSRRENQQLQTDYGKLQESYNELEQLKDKLENKEETWKLNLTDSQKESENTKDEVSEYLCFVVHCCLAFPS